MLAALVSLLKALKSYFDYKSKVAEFDILDKIDDKIKQTKKKLNEANDAGDLLAVDSLLFEHDRLKSRRDDISSKVFGDRKGYKNKN